MSNVANSILQLLSEAAAFVRETEDQPLAKATADVLQAMQVDFIVTKRDDLVNQAIMRSLEESGSLGLGVPDLASLRTERPN